MREAGMITQKEYDRIVERSQPQTTTVTTGGGGSGANVAAIEAQIAQVIGTNGCIHNCSSYSRYGDGYL